MKVFAKFDEIPSMILEVIKETKRYRHTFGRTVVRSVGQRENSIPSHKHSFAGGIKKCPERHVYPRLVSFLKYKHIDVIF